jgi:hypothetical protein
MPTIEGTRVKCPECGATTHASGDVIKCEYCGTESRVQRRTQVFQLPIKMPPVQASHPQRIATEVRTRRWPVVLLVVVPILFPFVLIAGIYLHQRGSFLWNGHMMIVDVDGDGIDDAVGIARYVSGDRMKLRAVSGKDGHTIWQTDSLGTYSDTYRSLFSWSGSTIVRARTDKTPGLDGFDLKTGKPLWHAVPSETVDRTCHSPTPNSIELYLKDQTLVDLDLATGKLGPAPSSACERLGHPHQADFSNRALQAPGMHIETIDGDVAPFIALGKKSPGTAIPMLAAFADDDHLLWKSEVAGHDARQTKEVNFAVSDQLVAALWDWEKDTRDPGVTVFDRATGKRLWEADATYTGRMFISLHGIWIGNTTIFAVVEDSLQAFDVQTGKRKFVVGSTN